MTPPRLTPEALAAARAAIARLGVGPYRDGSSVAPGHLYQPIGYFVPELASVPCHKPEAVLDDCAAVLADWQAHPASTTPPDRGLLRVCEIGAAVGYYALAFAPVARRRMEWLAIEADPAAHDCGVVVTQAEASRGLEWVAWLNAHATGELLTFISGGWRSREDTEPHLVLCLNIHQWLEAQGRAADVMETLGSWARIYGTVVYFQTAGQASEGMARVAYLRTQADEAAYLHDACGFPRVTFLRTTTLHGGARHLWRCEGAA